MPSPKEPKPLIQCDTLRKNMELLFGDYNEPSHEPTIESNIKTALEHFQKVKFQNLYKTEIDNITEQFSISVQSKSALESLLVQLSLFYILFVLWPHSSAVFEKYFKQLSEITKAATKLRDILNSKGNDFADFLTLIESADPKQEGDIAPHKFLYDLVESLNQLIMLPTQISKTNMAKTFKIGAKGRKPNVALYGWISHLLEFWEQELGRSMQRDVTQLSGRKQFLEFLDRSIAPLHPDIMLHNSDALDTMLKTVQADHKHGENRAVF